MTRFSDASLDPEEVQFLGLDPGELETSKWLR